MEEKREKKREPLSWNPMQRVQNDAEAGRGETPRTARRYDGGRARVWWGRGTASSGRTGPAGPVPRSSEVGTSRFPSLSLSPSVSCGRGLGLPVLGGGSAKNRGGAAYDPARRVPRVSSYALPRTIDNEPWRTAVVYCREFFVCPTNDRPLTHFCGRHGYSFPLVARPRRFGPGSANPLEP